MIAGVATETIVESTRIMKKPRQRANSAGHGSFSSTAGAAGEGLGHEPSKHPDRTMHSVTHQDLMAGPPPTHLPARPRAGRPGRRMAPGDVVRRHPRRPSPGLAVGSLAAAEEADPLTVYAYARVGYHRSLDLLRRNGWKGQGPVPWEHEPNRGFLGCLALLAQSARAIGETDEWDRCSAFLRDSSPAAYDVLLGGLE